MVYVPHRGDLPARIGPGVPLIPDIGPAELDSSVYTDPARFEQERRKVLNRSWQIICRSERDPEHRRSRGLGGPGRDHRHQPPSRRRGQRLPQRLPAPRRPHRPGVGPGRPPIHLPLAQLELRPRGHRRRRAGPRGLRRDGSSRALCAPPVECAEWGGWVWAVLAGPGVAPPLADWIGAEIAGDLGAYRMEDMVLHDKLTWELEANWKVVIDGFNENYHAAHLHTISPQDVKDGRFSTYFVFGRNGMMVVPYKGVLPELKQTADHQSLAICHYTIFPTSVFNNNPSHLQLFRAVPIAVDRTRFEMWELWYPDGDDEYLEKTGAHWERLKGVVAEDVDIYQEWAAARRSTAYTRNIFNNRECKITHFHRVVQDMLDAD